MKKNFLRAIKRLIRKIIKKAGKMSKSRQISKSYPAVSGLTAGTTKQTGRQENLLPQEGSLIPRREKKGINLVKG